MVIPQTTSYNIYWTSRHFVFFLYLYLGLDTMSPALFSISQSSFLGHIKVILSWVDFLDK